MRQQGSGRTHHVGERCRFVDRQPRSRAWSVL